MHADISARMDRAFGPWGSQSLAEIERSIQRVGDLVSASRDGPDAASGARSLGLAHALVAVGRLPVGSRVLDASSPPSGLSTSLAALGYDVSVVASLPAGAPRVRRRHRRRRERGLARPRTLRPARRDARRQPGVERRRCPRASAGRARLGRRRRRSACSSACATTSGSPSTRPGALPGETVALVTATARSAPGAEPADGGRQARVGVASTSDE